MFKFFTKPKKNTIVAKTPEGSRIYAIGDIHGRVDLLRKIHKKIAADAISFRGKRKVIVYLGDYIDRGFRSKEVLEEILSNELEGFETVYLKGNHEYTLLKFLEQPQTTKAWIVWGGDACLRSYGIKLRCEQKGAVKSADILAKELIEKLPQEHINFFKNLKTSHEEGDFFFIHAGLRPDVNIAEQDIEDMLMIRDQFIYSDYDFGKTIVFGHTVFEKPYQAQGRLGIDTGAYASGILTCAVLEDEKLWFLPTSGA